MTSSETEVLVFDLYGTLVDPLAISAALAEHLPGPAAEEVAALWRTKQIEYAFRLTMMQRYRDFEWVTARALDFALLAGGYALSEPARRGVLQRYDAPDPFPDVVPGLELLRAAGHQLFVLSNGSPEMLQRCLLNSGLVDYFTAWLSVDDVAAFKPDPQVYRHAGTILGRPLEQLRLISCNPFDVIGGKSAGMRTAWVNRYDQPFDTIGEAPDLVARSLLEVASGLGAGAPAAGT